MEKIISTLKELGNLVTLHFMWVDWVYKLDIYPSQNIDTKVTQHYYKEILPQQLFELSGQLNSDLTLILLKDSAIYDKIRTNIDKLQESERERFIFSLLQPFGEYCNIRVDSGKFKDLITTATKNLFQRNIESSLLGLISIIQTFFTTIDAILLERGINLLWYQEMSGIYLIEERDKRDYIEYLGSEKLVQRYIDEALPKLEPQQAPEPTNTKPQQEELTEREKQYYEKAITQGMAIKTDSGYKWLYCSGSKVSLVYFLSKVFCPKGVEQIPFKRLNNLWGVSRLDSANDQLANAKKNQQWRQHIDNLF